MLKISDLYETYHDRKYTTMARVATTVEGKFLNHVKNLDDDAVSDIVDEVVELFGEKDAVNIDVLSDPNFDIEDCSVRGLVETLSSAVWGSKEPGAKLCAAVLVYFTLKKIDKEESERFRVEFVRIAGLRSFGLVRPPQKAAAVVTAKKEKPAILHREQHEQQPGKKDRDVLSEIRKLLLDA